MNKIKNAVKHYFYVKFPVLYSYQPGEFLPIYSDGTLLNRKEFYAYKAGKAARAILARIQDAIYDAIEAIEAAQKSQAR